MGRVSRIVARLCLSLLTLVAALGAEDAREIVRRSVTLDQQNFERLRNYTWVERNEERALDAAGKVKSRESETRETTFIEGRPYERLIARDDKPLSPKEEQKESERLAKETAQRRRETPEHRRKREAERQKQLEQSRRFLGEVADAFEFRLAREERIDGRDVYVIEATPRPDYRPRESRARVLSKIQGTLWIDKEELQWVKVDAITIDTISFGLFLARLGKGARVHFEQSRVNDELWLPRLARTQAEGRLALLKNVRSEYETTWKDYRKFHVDSRIVSTSEIP